MKLIELTNIIFECEGKNLKGQTERYHLYLKASKYYTNIIADKLLHNQLDPFNDEDLIIKTLRGLSLIRNLVLTKINEMHTTQEEIKFED